MTGKESSTGRVASSRTIRAIVMTVSHDVSGGVDPLRHVRAGTQGMQLDDRRVQDFEADLDIGPQFLR